MELEKINIKKSVKGIKRIIGKRFMFIMVIIVVIFNLYSTKLLPKEMFLVYASNIDVNELVNLANSERTSRGLNSLSVDSRLVNAAYAKGQDMLEKDYWSHYGPNGESPWEFILATGYDYVYAGENLAKDFSTAVTVHSAWMASPSHKANIINTKYYNVGIAAVTGEFQGSETTIVVQMFGSLEIETEVVLSEESQEEVLSLPEGGGEFEEDVNPVQSIKPPEITKPKDGDILKDGLFDIRGRSEGVEKVHIYDNGDLKGLSNVTNSKFIFETEQQYSEGIHKIYAKSEKEDGSLTKNSNIVKVTVDTITPYINIDSFDVLYEELSSDYRGYEIQIEVEDNPIIVEGIYRDQKLIFTESEGKWISSFQEDQDDFSSLSILASDKAGNEDQAKIEAEKVKSIIESKFSNIGELNLKLKNWFVENLFTRIFTRSLRGKVNFLLTLVMVIILSVERIMLARSGLTKMNASSFFHIPVFSLLLFVSLIGGGGEIL